MPLVMSLVLCPLLRWASGCKFYNFGRRLVWGASPRGQLRAHLPSRLSRNSSTSLDRQEAATHRSNAYVGRTDFCIKHLSPQQHRLRTITPKTNCKEAACLGWARTVCFRQGLHHQHAEIESHEAELANSCH